MNKYIPIPLNLVQLDVKEGEVFYRRYFHYFIWKGDCVYDSDSQGVRCTKLRCQKKIGNRFKLFVYVAPGDFYRAIYFILDTKDRILYQSDAIDNPQRDRLISFMMYLNEYGSLSEIQKQNKEFQDNLEFNPADGI